MVRISRGFTDWLQPRRRTRTRKGDNLKAAVVVKPERPEVSVAALFHQ